MVRRRLVAADGASLRPHDHTAWCGTGEMELHRLAGSTFSGAAERDELMLFISEKPHPEWLDGLAGVDELIERNRLQLISVEEIYEYPADRVEQLERFNDVVDQALAAGYTGVSVVADNSRLVGTTDADFESWLMWEAMADQLQATRPIFGVCFFDRDRVPAHRMQELAAMHPVRSETIAPPPFQVFCDSSVLRLVGEIDAFLTDEVRRVVGSAVNATDRDLDVSELEFIDHSALLALDGIARAGAPVRVHGAREIVHRMWNLLDIADPALELC